MSINELNRGSVGSWGQFVSLKEAAQKRNFSQSAGGASGTSGAGGAKFSEILSAKGGGNVYLDPNMRALKDTLSAVRAKDVPAKGKMFDSYA